MQTVSWVATGRGLKLPFVLPAILPGILEVPAVMTMEAGPPGSGPEVGSRCHTITPRMHLTILATCWLRRQVFPGGVVPGKPRHGSDPCPKCHYQLSHAEQTFCVTCGHYDPQMRAKPAPA